MSKYKNKKTEVNGILFDSKKEATYYLHLLDMYHRGEISGFMMQVPYELIPAVYKDEVKHLKTKDKTVRKCIQKAAHYIADFVYVDKDGKTHVIDVKSFITRKNPVYTLKKKMMLAFKGIAIEEI